MSIDKGYKGSEVRPECLHASALRHVCGAHVSLACTHCLHPAPRPALQQSMPCICIADHII